MFKSLKVFAAAAALCLPTLANAQVKDPKAKDGGSLPAPQSDNDPRPPAARNVADTPGITSQAGIGGTQAYGRAGVLELGGSIGFSAAEDFKQFRATPSIGYFVVDNLQLSLLTNINYVKQGDFDASKNLGVVIEPSYHLPVSDALFIFGGVGAGISVGDDMSDDDGDAEVGLLISPRLGMNLMVGRSGILSPYIHFDYATVDTVSTPAGQQVAVNTSYGFNVGYTVMW